MVMACALDHSLTLPLHDLPPLSIIPGPIPIPSNECTGKAEVMVMACAFGNSLTLPLAYLEALLSGPALDRAMGYTALTALAWAPLMWGLGQALLLGPSAAQSGQR